MKLSMGKQREWLLISLNYSTLQVLDPSENLYVIGGNTFDRTTRSFGVLSDIHIFQLRDAFYKYCSVTGAGLLSAVAGKCQCSISMSTHHTDTLTQRNADTATATHTAIDTDTQTERARERERERERDDCRGW